MVPILWPEKKPVLVLVDDQRETLAALRRVLSAEPYEVLATTDPNEVLDWVRSRPIDLVVADYRMPEMSGTELLRAVRNDSPETTSMILTAYPDTALVCERASLRIRRLLTKPWDDRELCDTIREVLHEKEGLQPWVDEEDRVSVLRIDCEDARASGVLEKVTRFCSASQGSDHLRMIVIESLPLLEDSVACLLKGLLRTVAESGVRVKISDPSGLAAAFLDAVGIDEGIS